MQDYFDALVHGLLSSITWKKALQISPEDASRFEVTGTIRTQIERLTTNLHEFHATWLAPFEIAMNLYFFYSFEGSRCFFILPSLTSMFCLFGNYTFTVQLANYTLCPVQLPQ